MDNLIQIIQSSIKEIAGMCDSAISKDGAGFDKTDFSIGHSLAKQSEWSLKQIRVAARLVLKYRGQLNGRIDEEKIKKLIENLNATIENEEKRKLEDMKVFLLTEKSGIKKLAIKLPYEKIAVDKIKTLEGRRWNQEQLRWEVPILNLVKVKTMFPNAEYSDGIKDYEETVLQKDKLISEEFKQIVSEIDLSKPLPDGKTPFAHQKSGILRLVKYRRQILADDMGLGKTFQSLVAAKILAEYYNWNIIVICPVSLIEKPWMRDALALKISKLKISIHSWAKIPPPPPVNYILIADEAHYAQAGGKTIRGKSFLTLALHDNCKACIAATGTPIKNGRPINIFPLLQAVRHSLANDSRYFQTRYCNAHLREFGKKNKRRFWDTTGSSHLEELNHKIKDVMIRRTKKECLDLPDKMRVLREAELSEESKKLYDDTLKQLRDTYKKRLGTGEIKEEGEAMVMLQHLAHAGALGKIESAYEIATEVIEEGNQAVIFSTFREPLQALKSKFEAEGISAELLLGDTKDRGKLVDRFLAGQSRVFLLSMAGGVGIDLYTATTIILINRPWTPGDTLQIEDRCHRIGQKNPVTSIWLQHGEVDIHVDDILESKSVNIAQVMANKNKNDDIITFAKKYFKAKR